MRTSTCNFYIEQFQLFQTFTIWTKYCKVSPERHLNRKTMTKDNSNDFIPNISTVFCLRESQYPSIIFIERLTISWYSEMALMHISGRVRRKNKTIKRNIALNTKRPCFACALLCLIELTSKSKPRPTCRAENLIPPTPPRGIKWNHSPEENFQWFSLTFAFHSVFRTHLRMV